MSQEKLIEDALAVLTDPQFGLTARIEAVSNAVREAYRLGRREKVERFERIAAEAYQISASQQIRLEVLKALVDGEGAYESFEDAVDLGDDVLHLAHIVEYGCKPPQPAEVDKRAPIGGAETIGSAARVILDETHQFRGVATEPLPPLVSGGAAPAPY